MNNISSYLLMTLLECVVFLLRYKYEAFDKFKVFNALVETELDLKIKCLGFDSGEEFISDKKILLM